MLWHTGRDVLGLTPGPGTKAVGPIAYDGRLSNAGPLRDGLGGEEAPVGCDAEIVLRLADGHAPPEEWLPRLEGQFAFALAQGDQTLLARDPWGVKPLWIGRGEGGTTVFASELKAMRGARDVTAFPPGHVYTPAGGMRAYHRSTWPQKGLRLSSEALIRRLRDCLAEAVGRRLDADGSVGAFLSGGLDSSLIVALASRRRAPLDTFAVGTAQGADLDAARAVAEALGTRHHEYVFTIDEAIAALPTVIYHLESFDFALVRGAVANFFLSRLACRHVRAALTGEGADELFAGYAYLKRLEPEAVEDELRQLARSLHNTGLQRCDRMGMAHGLEVRFPFLDPAVVELARAIPLTLRQHGPRRTEKWILRQVAEGLLPRRVAWRRKAKFAVGAGVGESLARFADQEISDHEFARERQPAEGYLLRSKEELLYFRLFRQAFPDQQAFTLVGRTRGLKEAGIDLV